MTINILITLLFYKRLLKGNADFVIMVLFGKII